MADERRYGEDEVREILDRATQASRAAGRSPSSADGLTLAELEDIGREVGLRPGRIAEAAAALDVPGVARPRRNVLGQPISVGRVVELPRAPTDEEWALLVAELRTTFAARGKVGGQGSLREWWNGNLHAAVEPTEVGFRLRLGTLKGSAGALDAAGLVVLGVALTLAVGVWVDGDLARLVGPALLALMGAGGLAYNALSLPRWAREREGQMEYIARRAREIVTPSTAIGSGDDPHTGARG